MVSLVPKAPPAPATNATERPWSSARRALVNTATWDGGRTGFRSPGACRHGDGGRGTDEDTGRRISSHAGRRWNRKEKGDFLRTSHVHRPSPVPRRSVLAGRPHYS